MDHFKKQFAYLEENYGNGATVAPPERQHASLPRYVIIFFHASQMNLPLFVDATDSAFCA